MVTAVHDGTAIGHKRRIAKQAAEKTPFSRSTNVRVKQITIPECESHGRMSRNFPVFQFIHQRLSVSKDNQAAGDGAHNTQRLCHNRIVSLRGGSKIFLRPRARHGTLRGRSVDRTNECAQETNGSKYG
jgi:hypothetical protein